MTTLGQDNTRAGFGNEEARVVTATIARLESRRALYSIASEVLHGIKSEAFAPAGKQQVTSEFVGENGPTTICGPPDGEGTTKFHCSDSFDCAPFYPDGFTCDDGLYNCGTQPDFECGDDYDCESNFECDADIFDCFEFGCLPGGGGSGFECDQKFDFVCGLAFDCEDTFDCGSGHVFVCATDHDCLDTFQCSAGGTACQAPNTYTVNNGEPGDFLCSFNGGLDNAFDCGSSFDCKADDQFLCDIGGSFTCQVDFDCTASQFDCSMGNSFDCAVEFDCAGMTDFDCTGGFTCSNDYDCETTFNCEGVSFDCTESEFDCKATFECKTSFNGQT